jgi:alkylated DNA repair dioxygenase AlkB
MRFVLMMSMNDLFPSPAPNGLSYSEGFISPGEERDLSEAIDAAGLAPFRFQGWLGKRLTASFGWHYDFDRARFAPTAPIPDFLLPVRTRAAAFAGVKPADLVQALLIRYDPGAGILVNRAQPRELSVIVTCQDGRHPGQNPRLYRQ